MAAWSFIADDIHLLPNLEWDKTYPVFKNSLVEEYVNSNPHDRRYFIVGPKGVGKTLLLKSKSHILRNQKKGMIFLPHNELIEKIYTSEIAFSATELSAFKRLADWEILWRLCLATTILVGCGRSVPEKILNVIGKAKRLNEIFIAFLYERKLIHELKIILSTDLMPELDNIEEGVAMFVDNIDEGFSEHTGHHLAKNKKDNLSEEVWVNAQLGFIYAVKSIVETRPKIKIFASIRIEAFKMDYSATALQMHAYATILEYSVEDLQKMVIKNIEVTPAEKLLSSTNTDPFVRFFGVSEVKNIYVNKGKKQQYTNERIFGYMLRHSFLRPRELMHHGNELYSLDNDLRSESSNIRSIINATASKLFTQYKNEFIPYFDDYLFDEWCKLVPNNILTARQIENITLA